ncbi:ABC transporter permease [Spongiactinospora sp. TRM90649]|uniref:ABC transporter permease n=1 Tax=Spongiactinospora sp. TRM90649 TaxID=3031114 RepID=UPI0023F6767C|nr:ABC transporter permease [Spongiactinospora sp. TRM90649]MDF5752693.1 ABC transporter permease [Spongiactinospora sp. TRM90649]
MRTAPHRLAAGRVTRPLLAAVRWVVSRLWLAALFVGIWEAVTRQVREEYFPPPSEIVAAGYELWFSGPPGRLFLTEAALADFGPSLFNLFAGWLLTSLAGVALGVALGLSRTLADLAEPLVHFGRAVPPPTLLSVFLAVFALGTSMQVATIVFGVIWPVLLNTAAGVRAVDRLHLDTAEVFGVRGPRRLFSVILPAAAPKIVAGLRIGIGLALILMVLSELSGGTAGIGAHLMDSQRDFELADMWAGIVFLGVLGYLLNAAFALVERRWLRWHTGARAT